MKHIQKILFTALGFALAALTISLTPAGAQIAEDINRVFIANDERNPVPITSRETLKMQGEVKIDGKPEVKLDGDSKIKIESIEKPVKIELNERDEAGEAHIFKKGKIYRVSFNGADYLSCATDKISGGWIHCSTKKKEGIDGWINAARIAAATETR